MHPTGAAYVFATDGIGEMWSEKGKLVASDGGADDDFGISVSVYNNIVVAGAHYDDEKAFDSGLCRYM